MKFKNKKVDKETLDRLEKYGILLNRNAQSINRQQALILLGEAMLDKFVKEFVSLWKNELFPNCRLQDFEVSDKEKQHILSEDGDNNKDSEPTEHNSEQCCRREDCTMDSEGCCDVLTKAKEHGKRQPIFIYRASAAGHSFVAEMARKYKKKILPVYVRDYQLANKPMSYRRGKRKLPDIYRRFWKERNKSQYITPKLKVLEHYRKQTAGISYGHKLALYKSLEAYLS
jgi:hypothetical protein